MSLYNFLYKLQRKPEKYKKKVLVVSLAVVFLLLAVFWVVTFKGQVAKTSQSYSEGKVADTLGSEKMLTPIAALVDGFKSLKSEITQKIQEYNQKVGDGKDARPRPVYELPVN